MRYETYGMMFVDIEVFTAIGVTGLNSRGGVVGRVKLPILGFGRGVYVNPGSRAGGHGTKLKPNFCLVLGCKRQILVQN